MTCLFSEQVDQVRRLIEPFAFFRHHPRQKETLNNACLYAQIKTYAIAASMNSIPMAALLLTPGLTVVFSFMA